MIRKVYIQFTNSFLKMARLITTPKSVFNAHTYRKDNGSGLFFPINDASFIELIEQSKYGFYFNTGFPNAPHYPMQNMADQRIVEELERKILGFFEKHNAELQGKDLFSKDGLSPIILTNAYRPINTNEPQDDDIIPLFCNVAIFYRMDLTQDQLGAYANKPRTNKPELSIYQAMKSKIGPSQQVLEFKTII